MAEDIPARKPEGLAEGRNIAGVVLDPRDPDAWGNLTLPTAALIVEDELPRLGER